MWSATKLQRVGGLRGVVEGELRLPGEDGVRLIEARIDSLSVQRTGGRLFTGETSADENLRSLIGRDGYCIYAGRCIWWVGSFCRDLSRLSSLMSGSAHRSRHCVSIRDESSLLGICRQDAVMRVASTFRGAGTLYTVAVVLELVLPHKR